jgi:taurine dioxygenase
MKINPIDGPLGVEITDIDLSQEISEEDRKAIYDAYIEHLVLLFHDQDLSDNDLARLREIFGPAGETASRIFGYGREKDELPAEITIISNIVEDGRKIGSLGDGEAFWHTDASFTDIPISASLLYALEVTDEGGETAFLDMYRAYEDLPEALRQQLAGKYANHSTVHSSNGAIRPGFEEVTDVSECPGIKHPLIRQHPVSGRKCLFLGRRLNAYIFGLPVAESEDLLDRLWAHTCRDKYIWEHKWQVGDLLIWDNRCTMHHRNAFSPDARRRLHKTVAAGEAVIAA